MPRKKTPIQLDREIAASLVKKKPRGFPEKRAASEEAQRERVRRVAEVMAEITDDPAWLRVDLDKLASWLDLGLPYSPNDLTPRELAEQARRSERRAGPRDVRETPMTKTPAQLEAEIAEALSKRDAREKGKPWLRARREMREKARSITDDQLRDLRAWAEDLAARRY